MAKAFPEIPRADCAFDSLLEAIEGPMMPKPKWAGAASYDDPAFPSGGGPDDVPPAPPLMGQALPATISPPFQTPLGGGGGSTIFVAQATADASGGTVTAKRIQHKVDLSATPNFEQTGDALTLNYFKT